MTPAELAAEHPRLYHITTPGMLPSILEHGLLPTSALLTLLAVPERERQIIERQRRPLPVQLRREGQDDIIINDNLPLSEKALAACLDDGLSPQDWLLMLNARAFFWPDKENMRNHLAARFNRGKTKLVLEFDTLLLAQTYAQRLELAPFNTGSTIRKPARRGLSTFTPLATYRFSDWRKLRGGRDNIKEVAAVGGIPDVRPSLVASHEWSGG